jgi:hypothetical protein
MSVRTRIIAIVVVGLIGAILWWQRGGRDRHDVAPRVDSADRSAAPGTTVVAPLRPVGSGPGFVEREPNAAPIDPHAPLPTRTYVMDNGAVVRDHRPEDHGEPIAPPPMPPEQRTMSSAVTAVVYQRVAPVVAACAAKVVAADRGKDPFVYLTLTVAVTHGKLTVADSFPTANDIGAGAKPALLDCVRAGTLTQTVEAVDEPDRDNYIVQYPIRIR